MKPKTPEDLMNEDIHQLKKTYPGNSKASKEMMLSGDKKAIKPIVQSPAKRKKKSAGKRITETLVGEDVDNVMQYLIYDVLVPSAKSTIIDMVSGGIEMLLGGERKNTRMTRDRGRSYVNYSSSVRDHHRVVSPRSRSTHIFDDILLQTRGDAEAVLSQMVDIIDEYGQVSVADLYDLVDISGEFTDHRYGWTNLSRATVERTRGGYLLNLPKTVEL